MDILSYKSTKYMIYGKINTQELRELRCSEAIRGC